MFYQRISIGFCPPLTNPKSSNFETNEYFEPLHVPLRNSTFQAMHTNHFIALASLLFAGTLANCYTATIAYRDSSAGADKIKKKQTGMFLKTFVFYIAALIAFALYSLFANWGVLPGFRVYQFYLYVGQGGTDCTDSTF